MLNEVKHLAGRQPHHQIPRPSQEGLGMTCEALSLFVPIHRDSESLGKGL